MKSNLEIIKKIRIAILRGPYQFTRTYWPLIGYVLSKKFGGKYIIQDSFIKGKGINVRAKKMNR